MIDREGKANTSAHVKPRYGSRCFADIPAFLRSALVPGQRSQLVPTGSEGLPQRYNRVIVLFVDAFGWRFFERYRDRYPFLGRFAREGSVTLLTSQFPSTTSAHVTTLYTGQEVGQHGVFEWFYYEPQADAIIAPLLFSYAGDGDTETLREAGYRPEQLFPLATVPEALAADGVATFVLQPAAFAHSSYSTAIGRGAQLTAYGSLPEALVSLTDLAEAQTDPTCYFFYFGDIDTAGHKFGTDSPQFGGAVDAYFTAMERWFNEVGGRLDNTLLVLLADHGQTDVNPETTIYLNLLPDFPRLQPLLRTNRRGQVLMPGGSCRDMFVYLRPGVEEEAADLVGGMLAGKAQVRRVSEMINAGYFSSAPVSDRFRARVGDLVILPHDHEGVWWFERNRFEQKLIGHHGGLTAAEMEIPFLLLPL